MKIAIIGGGPGGYVAAIRAAQLGAAVTLIEENKLGGTCLNVGCIPTKALLHTAELYDQALHGADCGIQANVSLDFSKAMESKTKIVNKLVGGVTGLMKANNVKVMSGKASFVDNATIEIAGAGERQQLTADKFIIASGSVPVMPPIPGLSAPRCIDSTGALTLTAVPKSMVIIGGGVIGVEMATMYSALGCNVTIVEMFDRILPLMDRELALMLQANLLKDGVNIYTSSKLVSIEKDINIQAPSGALALNAEKVLVSIGRKPNIDGLALDKAGVNTANGRITVNNKQETSAANMYAIGDCTGGIMLAHAASAHGEVAAENACGHSAIFDGRTIPSCVYTRVELASVGLSEEQAQVQGIDYVAGRFPLAANGKSLIMNADGIVKIIAGKQYGEVLGVHIYAPRATELIAEGALAIRLEATVDELIDTIHAHPTVGESVREAALQVYNRALHIPNKAARKA
ncbi:MAG: dihydrolipoyl dehydrogenase [Treponema sp.]|nr:dihydrolipoyl dehydrogenase [Treponema sp.]